MKLNWAFRKKFPFLNEWLELEITRANRLPEKVERRNVPRGQLYPLARKKTLVALFLSVRATAGWKLNDVADFSGVSYSSLRHWYKEKRIVQKLYDFAKQFTDKFVEELLFVTTALFMDGSRGWPKVNGEHLIKLENEALYYRGIILAVLLEKLGETIQNDETVLSPYLIRFLDNLLNHAKPDTISGLKELYYLMDKTRKRKWEMDFSILEQQIKKNPVGVIHQVDVLKNKLWRDLDRLGSAEQKICELVEEKIYGKKRIEKQKQYREFDKKIKKGTKVKVEL